MIRRVAGCFLSTFACLAIASSAYAQLEQPVNDAQEQLNQAIEAGQTHMSEGNYEEAVASFTEVVRASSYDWRGFALRASALAALEEYEAALKDYKDALDKAPKAVPALVGRGQIYMQFGATELALQDFQLAVEEDRNNLDAIFGLGKALVSLGGAQQGVKMLDRAIAMDDQNHEAFRLRAQGQAALGKTDEAVADIQASLALVPEDYETFFALGTIMLQAEEYVPALEAIHRSIELYDPAENEGQPFSQGYLTKSAVHIELGKNTDNEELMAQTYEDAIVDCNALLELLPDSPATAPARAAALHTRGVGQRMLERFDEAVESFTDAININPDMAESFFRRGICFHLMDEDKLAIADFDQAAVISFADPRARLWQGFSYVETGDLHEAIRAFSLALAQSERYTPAYVNRGLTYLQLGEFAKSVNDFNEAIRLEPTEAEHYFKRGVAYEQMGDAEMAERSFTIAHKLDPEHEGANGRLGG
jgi:tetratricopeptide (TPR) repeat protein